MNTEPNDPYVMLTWTRRQVNPWDLKPEDISITDIAHSLSLTNRFLGHTNTPISVANHSLRVSRLLDGTGWGLEGLLHDATEAYLCDIPSPLKRQPDMEPYRQAEARAAQVIAEVFRLEIQPDGHPVEQVQKADQAAYEEERAVRWRPDGGPYTSWWLYEADFLTRFKKFCRP